MLSDNMGEELIQGLTDIFRSNISMIILQEANTASYNRIVAQRMHLLSEAKGLLPIRYIIWLSGQGDAMDESDIDIAIVIKGQMDEATKKRFICWAADINIRYERVFSIVDIQESNMKKWENVLPFYQNVKKEGTVLWKAA